MSRRRVPLTTILLRAEVHEELDRLADAQGVDAESIVDAAIRNYLDAAKAAPAEPQPAPVKLDPTTLRCVTAMHDVAEKLESGSPTAGLIAFSDASAADTGGTAKRVLSIEIMELPKGRT